MTTTTRPPVTVPKEVEEHIEKLGLGDPFRQIIEHTLQEVPQLRSLNLELSDAPCCGEEPTIVFWTHRPSPGKKRDRTEWNWGAWLVTTFPPEVSRHFVLLTMYEDENGR